MAKKVVAKTRIKHDGKLYEVGSELPVDEFDKEQLKQIYDSGAIEIVDEPTEEKAESAEPSKANVDSTTTEESTAPSTTVISKEPTSTTETSKSTPPAKSATSTTTKK
jgi:hypothetical protein